MTDDGFSKRTGYERWDKKGGRKLNQHSKQNIVQQFVAWDSSPGTMGKYSEYSPPVEDVDAFIGTKIDIGPLKYKGGLELNEDGPESVDGTIVNDYKADLNPKNWSKTPKMKAGSVY